MANSLSRNFDSSVGRQLRRFVEKGLITKKEAKQIRTKAKAEYRESQNRDVALIKGLEAVSEEGRRVVNILGERAYNRGLKNIIKQNLISGSKIDYVDDALLDAAEKAGRLAELQEMIDKYIEQMYFARDNENRQKEVEADFRNKIAEFSFSIGAEMTENLISYNEELEEGLSLIQAGKITKLGN